MAPPTPTVLSVRPLENKDARWLNLVQIEYEQVDGAVRTWEAMRRTTRPRASAVDGVQLLAVLEGGPAGPEVLLEKQFRPPAGKVVVEFPAGLVDEGETPEQCALRELREETGFVGEVVPESGAGERRPVLHSAAASSSSTTFLIKVRIDPAHPENQNPKPQLEEGEFIEPLWVPLKDLYAECRRLDAEGFGITSQVGSFAEGIEMSKLWQAR